MSNRGKRGGPVDLSGKKFGRWTVLKKANANDFGHLYYWCLCECGFKGRVIAYTLKSGRSQSCGCRQRELAAEKMQEVRKATRKYRRKEVADLRDEISYLRSLLEEHDVEYNYSAVAS